MKVFAGLDEVKSLGNLTVTFIKFSLNGTTLTGGVA